MENIQLSFAVVFPLFFYMAAGYVMRRTGILREQVLKPLNHMIFQVLIPASLFGNVYHSDLQETMNIRLFGAAVLLVAGCFLGLYFVVPHFVKDKKDAAVMIQGIYRSNFVLFGFTLGERLCDGGDIGLISAMAAFIIPLYNILAVILFETFRGETVNGKGLLIQIAKNPLVIAGIAGIGMVSFRIPIPVLVDESIVQMGSMASPMALICLGGLLSFSSVRLHIRKLSCAVLGRLVLVPVIGVLVGILLGYRGTELIALLALFASPTAVASAPMAYAMGGNGALAGEVVAATSAVSVVSLFCFIYVLKTMGYI